QGANWQWVRYFSQDGGETFAPIKIESGGGAVLPCNVRNGYFACTNDVTRLGAGQPSTPTGCPRMFDARGLAPAPEHRLGDRYLARAGPTSHFSKRSRSLHLIARATN
ncbi:MAG: hypothetical protein ACLP2J_09795, partial [Acidimicrobiales bacterium]